MHVELPLVVAGTAGKYLVFFYYRLKRSTVPKFKRICGLNIVVTVRQNRWFVRINYFLGIYHRMAFSGIYFCFIHACFDQSLLYRFGGFYHVVLMFTPGADGRDA